MMNSSEQTDTVNVGMGEQEVIDREGQMEADALAQQEVENEIEPEAPKEEVKVERAKRPEYWPEDLWDEEKGEAKLEDVNKKFKDYEEKIEDYRKRVSQRHKDRVPDEYKYEGLPDNVRDDPNVVNIFSDVAKEAGLSNEQANLVLKNYTERAIEIAQEVEDQRVAKEHEKMGPDKDKLIGGINNFIEARLQNKTYSQEEADALRTYTSSADAARALGKVLELTGQMKIPTSVRFSSDSPSEQDIKDEMTNVIMTIKDKRKQEVALKPLREKLGRINNG